ncbi:MAG: SCO family protein [Myxococcota bacterium]|nr:SCO family protein [Myxococcota bacterium]
MKHANRLVIRGLVAGMLGSLLLSSSAQGIFVTLPSPVPIGQESMDLIRNTGDADDQQWKLVVFGFTRCSDICPRSVENLSRLVKIANDKRIRLGGVFVTIDPDRDTDSVLDRYTAPFGKKTTFLRLEDAALDRFKNTFGVEAVFYTKNQGNAFHYQVDHSSTAFFVDPDGQIRLVFDALEDIASAEKMLQENQAFFQ